MIRSMTGFGRAERTAAGWHCTAELRSVNGRHLETRLRLPNGLGHLDDPVKRRIRARLSRGKVDGAVTLAPEADEEASLRLNRPLLRGLAGLLREAQAELEQPVRVTLGDLLGVRELVQFEAWDAHREAVDALVTATVDDALAELVAMRSTEGEALARDLERRTEALRGLIGEVEPLTRALPEHYGQRLRENLARLSESAGPPDERIVQEIALFAERSDVSEELARFRAHLEHLRGMLDNGGAVGRRIEFLLQELNRETNTLSVKASDAAVSSRVIEIKAELEKMREQIQNVE